MKSLYYIFNNLSFCCRQRISALKQEHQKEIKHIKSTLNNLRCSSCAAEGTICSHNCYINSLYVTTHNL